MSCRCTRPASRNKFLHLEKRGRQCQYGAISRFVSHRPLRSPPKLLIRWMTSSKREAHYRVILASLFLLSLGRQLDLQCAHTVEIPQKFDRFRVREQTRSKLPQSFAAAEYSLQKSTTTNTYVCNSGGDLVGGWKKCQSFLLEAHQERWPVCRSINWTANWWPLAAQRKRCTFAACRAL